MLRGLSSKNNRQILLAHNFSLSLQFLTTKAVMFAFAIIPHFDKYASVLPYKPFIHPFYDALYNIYPDAYKHPQRTRAFLRRAH